MGNVYRRSVSNEYTLLSARFTPHCANVNHTGSRSFYEFLINEERCILAKDRDIKLGVSELITSQLCRTVIKPRGELDRCDVFAATVSSSVVCQLQASIKLNVDRLLLTYLLYLLTYFTQWTTSSTWTTCRIIILVS